MSFLQHLIEACLFKYMSFSLLDYTSIDDPTATRYNKLPNDLLADLPFDLPKYPDVPPMAPRQEGETSSDVTPLPAGPDEPDNPNLPLPHQHHAQMPVQLPVIKPQVPIATLRYDPTQLAVHDRRMLGRPHGGTVVVHYLKRNEWFLETALAILGRHAAWDSGMPAAAYAPVPAAQQKVYSTENLSPATNWDGMGVVDILDPVWGTARMWGSPIVRENGYVSEGREILPPAPVKPVEPSVPNRFKTGPKFGYADPSEGPNFSLISSPVSTPDSTPSATDLSSPTPDSPSPTLDLPSPTPDLPQELPKDESEIKLPIEEDTPVTPPQEEEPSQKDEEIISFVVSPSSPSTAPEPTAVVEEPLDTVEVAATSEESS